MGFIDITLIDIIDILVVALIMFQIYRLTRGTNALRIGQHPDRISAVIVVRGVENGVTEYDPGTDHWGRNDRAGSWCSNREISKFLLLLGTQYSHRKNTLFGRWFKSRQSIDRALEWIDPIVNACADMAASKTGALIVIGRSISLDPLIERGEPIDARVSSALIKTIFFKKSPLHDGAIVIANGRIAAARCVLLRNWERVKLCLRNSGCGTGRHSALPR